MATRGRMAWARTRRVRNRLAMVRHDEEIRRAEAIGRAHQIAFLVPRQVAEVDRAEPPERDETSDRLCVLGGIRILLFVRRTERIRLPAAGDVALYHLPCRGHDAHVDAGQRDAIPGLGDGVLRLRVQRRVVLLQERIGVGVRLHVRPVIDVVLDRDPVRELRQGAEVIAVVVREHEVVDLFQTRVLHRRHDPLRVADGAGSAVTGVYQQGFAGRGHEQRRVAPFDVDDVDVERLGRPGLGGGQGGGQNHEQEAECSAHWSAPRVASYGWLRS